MTSSYTELSKQPLRLQSNRVWRTYQGGQWIEQWQGAASPSDGDFPEEWVASAVRAKNVGREHVAEGLSKLVLSSGEPELTLKELIASSPEQFLGQRHAGKYGDNLAVLVKVLDSSERLTIQVHPSPEFAMSQFQSAFGKTEAWYVIGGRAIDGVEPYLLFGFKPGVTKERWRELFLAQNIEGMIDALHRVPLREGEVFLIEGGVPHAIGSGCCLIEIQEPTDLTLRVERTTPRGLPVPDDACHQGIGFDSMLDCFQYEALEYEEAMRRWKKQPATLEQSEGGERLQLIGREDTDRFQMELVIVRPNSEFALEERDAFASAIVISGKGLFCLEQRDYELNQSEQWFLPASVGALRVRNTGDEPLHLVLCYPPES